MSEQSQQEKIEEIRQQYAGVYALVRDRIGKQDPRSYDKALARLEESMMWAIKGVQNGDDEQR